MLRMDVRIYLSLREIKQCQTTFELDNKQNIGPRKEQITGAKETATQ